MADFSSKDIAGEKELNPISKMIVHLESLDRRIVYLLVALSLAVPLIFKWSLQPAPMQLATEFYKHVSDLKPAADKMVLIAADWGPATKAENEPQTAVAMEHLMRKRIPFALISITPYAEPFLRNMPREIAARLNREDPSNEWAYGTDWVNFGYRPSPLIMIQGLAKTDDFVSFLKTDATGTPLEEIPCMKEIKDIRNIAMLMEFTGLVGAFEYWLQFFQAKGYQPPYVHGCTSITTPGAYIYFISNQIIGLHEGIGGAAWYEELLNRDYPGREASSAIRNNTSLAYAHLLILGFILLGNVGALFKWMKK